MLVAAIAFGQQNANNQKRPPSQGKALTRAEFGDLLAKPDQVLLIDLGRPDEEMSVGGLPAMCSPKPPPARNTTRSRRAAVVPKAGMLQNPFPHDRISRRLERRCRLDEVNVGLLCG
jgi:hypothetical protein